MISSRGHRQVTSGIPCNNGRLKWTSGQGHQRSAYCDLKVSLPRFEWQEGTLRFSAADRGSAQNREENRNVPDPQFRF
jgi:hypothetical protein